MNNCLWISTLFFKGWSSAYSRQRGYTSSCWAWAVYSEGSMKAASVVITIIHAKTQNINTRGKKQLTDTVITHLVDKAQQVFKIPRAVEQTVNYDHRLVADYRSPETRTEQRVQQSGYPAAATAAGASSSHCPSGVWLDRIWSSSRTNQKQWSNTKVRPQDAKKKNCTTIQSK